MLAGTGSNGGRVLVCARRLHIWGAQVQVYVTKPASDFTPVPAHQLAILQQMRIPIVQAEDNGSPAFCLSSWAGSLTWILAHIPDRREPQKHDD